MTFAATANSIIHAGGIPILLILKRNRKYRYRFNKRKNYITYKSHYPVHFAGRPCDIKGIMQIAEEYKLKVIEDCAHSIESEYNGKHVGTYGDLDVLVFM